jgi:hypothetical protein
MDKDTYFLKAEGIEIQIGVAVIRLGGHERAIRFGNDLSQLVNFFFHHESCFFFDKSRGQKLRPAGRLRSTWEKFRTVPIPDTVAALGIHTM